MKIFSPDFSDNGFIPTIFSCKGENKSPKIKITEIPVKTKSLALTMSDPDAPTGTFHHWVVWNIDPKINIFDSESIKGEIQEGTNSSGVIGYLGPCPPSGTHRYIFSVFALDQVLDLPESTTLPLLLEKIENHIIADASITGLFSHL